MPTPAGRFPWPAKSAYLPKSTIWARADGAKEAARAAVRAVTIRARMLILHRAAPLTGACSRAGYPNSAPTRKGARTFPAHVVVSDRFDVFGRLEGSHAS